MSGISRSVKSEATASPVKCERCGERAVIGDTKAGWTPFCAECLRDVLIPAPPTGPITGGFRPSWEADLRG